MNSPEWLFDNDRRYPDTRQVKISEGVFVIQKMLKTPGGLIRVSAINRNSRLDDVHYSGDFFFFPSERLVDLEKILQDKPLDTIKIEDVVEKYYAQQSIDSPGVTPADFGRVLLM